MNKNVGKWGVMALVAIAAAVVLFDGYESSSRHPMAGQSLVKESELAGLKKIEITRDTKKIEINRNTDNDWVVTEGGETFPADGAKIANFLDQMKLIQLSRVVSKDRATFPQMSDVVSLKLIGQKNIEISLGQTRQGGGQFLSRDPFKEVLISNNELKVQTDFEEWELKTLVSINPETIKSIQGSGSKKKMDDFEIARSKESDPLELSELSEKQKTQEINVKYIAGALENLMFTAKLNPSNEVAKTAMEKPKSLRYELFDGTVYQVKVGTWSAEDKKRHFIEITQKSAQTAAKDKKGQQRDVLGDLMKRYRFEISEASAKKFLKKRSNFFEASES
jgi:hypothetical protein